MVEIDNSVPFLANIAEAILSANSLAGLVIYEGVSGDCLLANKAVANMTGGSVNELQRQNFRKIESFSQSGLKDVIEQVLDDGFSRSHETNMRTSFGNLISFDCYISRFIHLESSYIILFISDITLRKQAETAVEMRERELQALIDNAPVLIIRYDPQCHRTYVNHAWEEASGIPVKELVGRPADEYPDKSIAPAPGFIRKLQDVLSSGVAARLEFTWINARREELYIMCAIVPEYDRSGNICGAMAFATNLTDRLRVETQMRQAKEMAEEATRIKSQFLANMSHEVRTPLNGIIGMLQLLGYTKLDAEQTEYFHTAVNASKRLTNLLTDILEFSKLAAGRLAINEMAFSVDDLREMVLNIFSCIAEKKEITLDLNIAKEMPAMLLGDFSKLKQILFHLLGNAVKFTDQGGVSLDVQPLSQYGDASCRILFTVTDAGIGIPDDMLAKIIAPFTQGDGSYNRTYQGAGLGLSICNKLVSLLGGTLVIDSVSGTGTTVYVALPFTAVE